MASSKIKFAPKEVFEQLLEWAVMPTFDLIIERENIGVILVKRTIAPYKNQWALPGLRMFKGEEIEDVLRRIAQNEIGVKLGKNIKKTILGQFVGKFKTEHCRQDISTGYFIKIPENTEININKDHFSSIKFIKTRREIPDNIGAMYKFYLENYFKEKI